MDYLVLSRAASATAEPDDELTERHWAYMDRYADAMTARGPTLAPDRRTWTGSLHVVDLPDAEAARTFVEDEPYQRAGLFGSHRIWRFTDLLGRTMWEFTGPAGEPRFVVLAPHPLGDLPQQLGERLVVHGELGDPDDGSPAGVAMAAAAPSRAVLDGWLAGAEALEVHDWEFGGRR